MRIYRGLRAWEACTLRNQDEQFFISVFCLRRLLWDKHDSVFGKRVWSPKRAGGSELIVLGIEASAPTKEEELPDEPSCEPFLI